MTDTMTNEGLAQICRSSFELTNFAIDLGRYYIHSGHETSMKEILRDVKRNPDPTYVKALKAIDEQEMQEREEERERGQ